MSDRSRFAILIAVIIALGAAGVSVDQINYDADLQNAKHRYRAERSEYATRLARTLTNNFGELYHSLRTIARLPGVRSIDRYAQGFSKESSWTVQEVYNNAASSVALSEIYIVSVDLEPDAIDPHTNELYKPILTYDQLIVNRHAGVETSEASGNDVDLEEIEIYEYRLMREQIAWFQQNCPTSASVRGLEYPYLSGREIITCDNTRYDPSAPDDRDRSGLVFSVPFYGPDEVLKGCISGVILSESLRDFLPSGDYALLNTNNGYEVLSTRKGVAHECRDLVHTATANPGLIYSDTIDLDFDDVAGQWILWAGSADSRFWNRPDVTASLSSVRIGSVAIFLLTLGAIIVSWLAKKNRQLVEVRNRELTNRVVESDAALIDYELRNKELQDARDAAEAAASARSEFLANVSHELRTPLHCILSLADLGCSPETSSQAAKVLEYFTRIRKSGTTLLALVNDLLDLAKFRSGKMDFSFVKANPTFLIRGIVDELQPQLCERSLTISIEEHGEIEIPIDFDKLKLVFRNLVGNAIKFSPRDGKILIQVESRPDDMLISIQDEGPGIPCEELESIFEKFFQSSASKLKGGGTGLGLSICSEIVDRHRGRIWATNCADRGAKFLVQLPRDGAGKPELMVTAPEADRT